MNMKRWSLIVLAALLFVGCSSKTSEEGARDGKDTIYEKTNYSDSGITKKTRTGDDLDRPSNNHTDRYDVSKDAARKIIKEIPEVNIAYVLTTNRNAYVAVGTDHEDVNQKDNLTFNDPQNSSAGMNVKQTNDRNATDRTVNEGDANKRGPDNHSANRKATPSDDVGNKRDVESDTLNDSVKNEIADIIQKVDNRIENVYVSTNPDFFNLAESYANDMEAGKPVEGFFDQIGNMVERIFPQNKR